MCQKILLVRGQLKTALSDEKTVWIVGNVYDWWDIYFWVIRSKQQTFKTFSYWCILGSVYTQRQKDTAYFVKKETSESLLK